MRRAARAATLTVLAMFVTHWLGASDAHAEEGQAHGRANEADSAHDAEEDAFLIPPAPARTKPRLAIEVHTGLTLPLENEALCPANAGCVLEAGGVIGVSLERRFPSGFGPLVAYDVWFIDSDSVYELAVQQILRGGLRYTMPTEYILHPIVELSGGIMGLGDTFRIASVGAVMQVFAGAEIELTETFGVRMGFGLRAFTQSRFETRDDVRRGGGVFSESAFLEVGLTIM